MAAMPDRAGWSNAAKIAEKAEKERHKRINALNLEPTLHGRTGRPPHLGPAFNWRTSSDE